MRTRILLTAAALGIFCGAAAAQNPNDERPAITARVHGTFVDRAGGGGVLSGDMTLDRFELRDATVVAIGRIDGSLADSKGNVLGLVEQELELPVRGVDSTCNQLRIDMGAVDADVLQTRVHFDAETAGFDSRDGATPRALGVLCAAGEALRKNPGPGDLVRVLENVAVTLKTRKSPR